MDNQKITIDADLIELMRQELAEEVRRYRIAMGIHAQKEEEWDK